MIVGTRPASLQTGLPIRVAVVDSGGQRLALGRAASGRKQLLLFERGQPGLAAFYIAASVVLSIGGLFAGLALVRYLT